jgi:competence protein ComEA
MIINKTTFVKLFFISSFLFMFTSPAFSQDTLQLTAEDQNQSININVASAETIAKSLKGVGLKKAQAIITYRETYGVFAHIDELAAVKGIGKSIIERNSGLISINED